MSKIKVVIADDNELMLDMTSTILKNDDDIEVVAELTDGLSILSVIEEKEPDIILLDMVMPLVDGLGVMEQIKDNKDRLKKVIYNLLESIRIGAVLLHSFLPATSEEIFRQLNTTEKSLDSINEFGKLKVGDTLNDPKPLFIRIEKEK